MQDKPVAVRPQLSAEIVARYRRMNLVFSVADAVCEKGFGATTVNDIRSRAGVARNTFYDYFANKGECVEWACREMELRLFGPLAEVADETGGGLDRLDRALRDLLATAAANPTLSELLLVHSPALGGDPLSAREEGIEAVRRLMQSCIDDLKPAGGVIPPLTAELFARGLVSLMANRLRRDGAGGLPGLREELLQLAGQLVFTVSIEAPTAV